MDIKSTGYAVMSGRTGGERRLYVTNQLWKIKNPAQAGSVENSNPAAGISAVESRLSMADAVSKSTPSEGNRHDMPIRNKTAGFREELEKAAAKGKEEKKEAFSIGDMVDVINPLQHIPLVSYAYRSLTSDEISPMSRVIGGALYGGPVGAVISTANVIIEHETGKDIVGNVVSSFSGSRNNGI